MPELPSEQHSSSPPKDAPSSPLAMSLHRPLSNNSLYLYSTPSPADLFGRAFLKPSPAFMPDPHTLQGLVESEVFVGGEEDQFLPDDQSHLDNVIPSSLVISYHKDSVLHPLNSVKEDIEAEAAEEEISGNFHSLDYLGLSMGPSSLSSSVLSSVSLDEVNFNTLPDRHHLATSKPQMQVSHCHHHYPHACKDSHASYASCEKSAAICKLRQPHSSNLNGKMSPAPSNRISPNLSKFSPPTSQFKDDKLYSKSNCCSSNNTPQKSYNSLERVKPGERRNLIWHNPSKSDKLSASKKDESSVLKRYGVCRAKSDVREGTPTNDSKFSSLPRRKKEKNEKDIVAETYGTLGRNRRKKEVSDQTPKSQSSARTQTSERHVRDLPQESKNILDKYATLPRKKAKEISGRWREQMNQKESKESRPPLQRSKSTGKGESSRSVRASPSPSLSSASSSSVNSPRVASASKHPSNTKLITKGMSPSAKLLARQTYSAGRERTDKSTSPNIYPLNRQPKLTRIVKKNAHVQVNLKWDDNESELEAKVRNLSEENLLLQSRLRVAEANAEEVEQMRMEAVELRRTAENEKMEKDELQEELDKTSSKVKDMLTSMEGIEKEFNNRGESLIELEHQLQTSSEFNIQMQDKLNQYEEYAIKLRKDLDKSLAAQKILLQQVQDLEAEGREMVEFMAEEKNALSECLKEAELELNRKRKETEELSGKLQHKDEEARHMVRLAEERRRGYISLQTELKSVQSSAEDMMVCQGAQLSEASVGLSNVTSRLQLITARLVQDYSISENDIENVVTPADSDSSLSSSANASPDLPKSPVRSLHRTSSPRSLLRTSSPRKPVSFMLSFLNAIRVANASSLKPPKICEERKSPEGSEQRTGGEEAKCSSGPQSLCEEVSEVDLLLTRFLKVCCVLKSDADNILTELEEENERLCSQIQLQQQMIDQQYSDFESLTNLESNARKELKLITKDLEFANATLNKVCDEDTKTRVKNVEDALNAINRNLGHMEMMHAEKRSTIWHARRTSLSHAQALSKSQNKTQSSCCTKPSSSHCTHLSLAKSKSHRKESKCPGGTSFDDFPNLNLSGEEGKEHDLDYVVNHVLKTLETVPDIVSTCPALKNLYLHLTATDPFERDVNCNPSSDAPPHPSTPQTSSNKNGASNEPHNENMNSRTSALTVSATESSGAESYTTASSETFLISPLLPSPLPSPLSNGNGVGTDPTEAGTRNGNVLGTSPTEAGTPNGNVPGTNPTEAGTPNGNVLGTNPTEGGPRNGFQDNSHLSIDCNANPEVPALLPTSSDPFKFIPLLTNETSL